MRFFTKAPSLSLVLAGLGLLLTTGLTSCGGSSDTATEETKKATPAPEIDGKGWVPTDLSTTSPKMPVIVNLPPNTKVEKTSDDEYASLRFDIGEFNEFSVRHEGMSVPESIANEKNYTALYDTSLYLPGKILKEDAQGFVYMKQQKLVEGGPKYEPEAHFVLFVKGKTDEDVYSIRDSRPIMSLIDNSGTWPEANATKLYDLMKASAKVK